MTLFWPDILQTSAQKNLRQTIYLLKQAIPVIPAKDGKGTVPLLLTDRQMVQINPDGRYQLDLHTFTHLLKQDESHWPEAVSLYRGDFLADFYLPDCAPFEEWAAARRADCRRQALDALDALTEQAILAKDYENGEVYARRQLELEILRESAHRQLMQVLMGNGRRRAALTQYETLVQLLQTEFAVAPSAATQKLTEAIRSGDLGPGSRELSPPHALTSSPSHNLPTQLTPFIGRETELAELAQLLLLLSGQRSPGTTSQLPAPKENAPDDGQF